MAEPILNASIVEETRHRYLTYALSVITSRALPDVRDGLKPVQRPILYVMNQELGLRADAKAAKCAKIVGEVMGGYHPHGDLAIYEALVRLTQNWVMRVPLVYGQGNFGSVDGDPPAAARYTEAKLTVVADYLLAELRQQTVPMRPTYDGAEMEPIVLPAQFPNVLVNGASGIAVGMATNIPPHNLGDAIRAAIHLIENPDATTAVLLDKLKGPDFPLGGKILTDRPTLRKIYEEGTGSIRVQGEWKLESAGKKEQIIVTSIPYGVNKGTLESDIGLIIEQRKLPQLTNLTNETNEKDGLRIALDIKPGSDPNLIMAYLYKHTALQENYAFNMTCLVPDSEGKPQPRRLSLNEMLRYFLDFRLLTVRKRFEFELEQLRKRIHILEGFGIVFNALDKAIRLIRESQGRADAAEKLMKAFKLDEIQTAAVLDAQLYKIAQMEIQKILEELAEKTAAAEKIEALLRSEKKLWSVIKDEMTELAEKHGDRRKTRLASGEEAPEFDEEAFIAKENTNVVLTRDGWIKRVGRLASVEGTRVREGDSVLAVVPGSTHDHVIFFADDGSAYTMRINEVPASSGYGEPIVKFFKLDDQVKIIAAVTTDERFAATVRAGSVSDSPRRTVADASGSDADASETLLLVVTAQGMVLRTPLAPFRTASNKLGRRYARLNDGDRVVLAGMLKNESSIFLASRSGHVIHFPIDQINILAGVGKGVIGIKLADDDACIGGALIAKSTDLLQVETTGGKTMEFTGRHDTTARGGKGWEAVKRTSFVRVVPPALQLVDWDEIEGKKKDQPANGDQPSLFE